MYNELYFRYIKLSTYKCRYYKQSTLLLFYFICYFVNKMPVIFESDEDKYYDKEDIKKYKKGSQSGIESRGSGIFLPGTKNGYGLYLPTRGNIDSGDGVQGTGVIDAIINAGKTVIEGLANNASTIGQATSAIGSVASATSNVADAVKSIKNASHSEARTLNRDYIKKKMEEAQERGRAQRSTEVRSGVGFKITRTKFT